MKEATNEVSGTVITILILAALVATVTFVLRSDTVKNWISNLFTNRVEETIVDGN